MKTKIISLFAGVGGIDLGFAQTGKFETVYANEFDKYAQATFSLNYGKEILDCRDIHDVNTDEIPDADVIVAGFPCQPFSIAGYRLGLDDTRGDLFFEALRVIEAKQPKVVLLENVKNLVTHDHGNTFKVIREFLAHAGYKIKWKVLNSKEYGNIPQNRERIYVVGFKNRAAYEKFEFPKKIPLTTSLHDVIDFDGQYDEKYYYREGKQPFFDKLNHDMVNAESIYQWRRQYVRENKSGVVPTLTANMGTGGHNVPLIREKRGNIRKLTARETFNVQGFPMSFRLPKLAESHLYKQAGNSVVVPVIKRIAQNIADVIPVANEELPDSHDKPALIYTSMEGRMEGKSYMIDCFKNQNQLNDILKDNTYTEFPKYPILNNQDFFNAVKKGGHHDFVTIVG